MKRVLCFLLAVSIAGIVNAQVSPDAIFGKYAGKKGFTSINFNPQILKLIAYLDDGEDQELKNISEKLTGMKILVSENNDVNFKKDLSTLLDDKELVNLMEIVESNSKVNFYAKYNEGYISDLVLVALEEGEDVFMSISGKFSLKEIAQIGTCSSFGSNNSHVALLRNLEEK